MAGCSVAQLGLKKRSTPQASNMDPALASYRLGIRSYRGSSRCHAFVARPSLTSAAPVWPLECARSAMWASSIKDLITAATALECQCGGGDFQALQQHEVVLCAS